MSSLLADNFFSPVPVQSLFYQLPDLLTLLSSSAVDGRSNVSGTYVNLAVHHAVVMDECLQRVIIISRLQLFAKSLKLFYLLPFRAVNKGTGERMEPSLV